MIKLYIYKDYRDLCGILAYISIEIRKERPAFSNILGAFLSQSPLIKQRTEHKVFVLLYYTVFF